MDEELLEKLEGTFSKTIYKSSNYMVSIFNSTDGTITVTGPSFDYDKNCKYTLVGKYIDHPKYGFQFEMLTVSKYLPSAKEEIIKYLSSPLFKGIGKRCAEKIYEVYKDETLSKIKSDLSLIDNLNISETQRKALIDGFSTIDSEDSDTIFTLINNGYSSKEANLIYSHFKGETLNIIKDNPFKIYLDIYGIPFNKVVENSKKLEFDDAEIKYKEALLIYIFKQMTFNSGDTYLEYDEIESQFNKYNSDFINVLNKAINDNYLIEENNKYYLKQDFLDECYIAGFLNEFKSSDLMIDEPNLSTYIKDNSYFNSIEYDLRQIDAIKNFYTNNFSLIIGGPGTGKTTIIKAFVDIFTQVFEYNNIIVIAPTGRASKRINEICNVPSKTIHSLLRWNKEDNTFIFNEDNPINYDAIIIDEFSMVDNNLFASLLKAAKNVKKICLIGDDNQLPSIRQGNVLFDLINSNMFPLTRLTHIFRQKDGNEIIELANDIVNNKIDLSKFNNDVKIININNFDKKQLIQYVDDDLSNGKSLDDIQILSPMYRGEFGIDALNLALQESFNPKDNYKKEKRIADCLYRENDKILQLKNRPDDDVYNGDIGILEEIDLEEKTFFINYKGIYIYYSFDELIDISLAYALSIHKAQGSEYPIVYLIISKSHSIMLNKKLIYTGISRAKNKLVLITDNDLFVNACQKQERKRKTTLISRLRNYK